MIGYYLTRVFFFSISGFHRETVGESQHAAHYVMSWRHHARLPRMTSLGNTPVHDGKHWTIIMTNRCDLCMGAYNICYQHPITSYFTYRLIMTDMNIMLWCLILLIMWFNMLCLWESEAVTQTYFCYYFLYIAISHISIRTHEHLQAIYIYTSQCYLTHDLLTQ